MMLVFAVIALASIVASPAAADVMCYACNSYMAQCNFDTLAANNNNNVFKARCTTKCFTRQGEDDAIYRGCFDAFKAVKQLTDDYVGCRNQTWNNRVRLWCLCDNDLCNRFPIEQNHHQLPVAAARHLHLKNFRHPMPAPPPQNYHKDAGLEPIAILAEQKNDQQPGSYRTVWTNWQALPPPGTGHRDLSADRRADKLANKQNVESRPTGHGGHVVSHSVYPDHWKANEAATVDRRLAKSSEFIRGRAEPLAFGNKGQMPRSDFNESQIVKQYEPSVEVAQDRPTAAAQRQSAYANVENQKQIQYDYTMQDFEDDTGRNETMELEMLEYPYNQEVTHQVIWTPFDDYLVAAGISQAAGVEDKPKIQAKMAPIQDEVVDYPYNQDHGAVMETFDLLNNGVWKEAAPADSDELTEDLGLIVDYPYNQLFGQDASDFPVLTGYYENSAAVEQQRQADNSSSSSIPVEHTVHAADFTGFDVVDLPPAPSTHHIYRVSPYDRASSDQKPRNPAAEHPQPPQLLRPSKTGDQLMAEVKLEKTRFVPVSAAQVDDRRQQQQHQRQQPSDGELSKLESSAGARKHDQRQVNVGYRRNELAKEAADSLDYVESLADIQLKPDEKFVVVPTVPQIRCVHTGYYQNPKDCTQFVACLFDHNTRTKVLHLMRCPSGLFWDNVHKLCMESSSTCHVALATSHHSAPIDSYMQYFANIAAAAAAADETSRDANNNEGSLTHPRVKEMKEKDEENA